MMKRRDFIAGSMTLLAAKAAHARWTSRILPHIRTGYARSPGESEYPGMWRALSAAWMFGMQGGGGSIAYDFSTQLQAGTINSVPVWSAGKYQSALDFDGTDDYVELGSDILGSTASSFTVSLLVNHTTIGAGANGGMFDQSDRGSDITHIWIYLSTADLRFFVRDADNNGLNIGAGSLTENVWYHIAATFDTGLLKLFVDGAEVASGTDATIDGSISGQNSIARVSDNADTTRYWMNGLIENVLTYNRALSSSEVRLLYDVPYAPFVKRRRVFFVNQVAPPAGRRRGAHTY